MATIIDLPAGTWTVDASHSEVGFVARHLMVTKVRGPFKEFEGTVTVADDVPDSQVSAVAQLATIDTGYADRDAHLRSADFFDVENNPDHELHLHRGQRRPSSGDLTIKGVTKPVDLRPRVQRPGHRPVGQREGRLRGHRRDQPQGLGPGVERRPRGRRRPGLREDQAHPRHPADQGCLTHGHAPASGKRRLRSDPAEVSPGLVRNRRIACPQVRPSVADVVHGPRRPGSTATYAAVDHTFPMDSLQHRPSSMPRAGCARHADQLTAAWPSPPQTGSSTPAVTLGATWSACAARHTSDLGEVLDSPCATARMPATGSLSRSSCARAALPTWPRHHSALALHGCRSGRSTAASSCSAATSRRRRPPAVCATPLRRSPARGVRGLRTLPVADAVVTAASRSVETAVVAGDAALTRLPCTTWTRSTRPSTGCAPDCAAVVRLSSRGRDARPAGGVAGREPHPHRARPPWACRFAAQAVIHDRLGTVRGPRGLPDRRAGRARVRRCCQVRRLRGSRGAGRARSAARTS